MTRAGHALLTVVGGACLALGCLGCNGATPRDQNFGTDAQAGFEVPPVNPDAQGDGALTGTLTGTAGDTGTVTGTAGEAITGTAGDTGALTATTGGAGSSAGGGAGASTDSGADLASDDGAGP
jgi:hypothetical protein